VGLTAGTAWVADWVGSTRLYVREEASLSWSETLGGLMRSAPA
jgi:hypothetical protein